MKCVEDVINVPDKLGQLDVRERIRIPFNGAQNLCARRLRTAEGPQCAAPVRLPSLTASEKNTSTVKDQFIKSHMSEN